jgi:hypothetical protein
MLVRDGVKHVFSIPPQDAEANASKERVNCREYYTYTSQPEPVLYYTPPKHMTYALILRQGISDLSIVYQADWIDMDEVGATR